MTQIDVNIELWTSVIRSIARVQRTMPVHINNIVNDRPHHTVSRSLTINHLLLAPTASSYHRLQLLLSIIDSQFKHQLNNNASNNKQQSSKRFFFLPKFELLLLLALLFTLILLFFFGFFYYLHSVCVYL